MTDRPIIFSASMVRALLDGRKIMTRRVLKPQPPNHTTQFYRTPDSEADGGRWVACLLSGIGIKNYGTRGPNRQIPVEGDQLWVREQWSGNHVFRNCKPSEREDFVGDGAAYFRGEIWYWADGSPEYGDWEKPRPSIHMPRWASRLTLTVTDVRVQRLQDISETDAEAEGAGHCDMCNDAGWLNYGPDGGVECHCTGWGSYVEEFARLWNSIQGPDAWDRNDWVAALTFDVHRCNIDQMEGI